MKKIVTREEIMTADLHVNQVTGEGNTKKNRVLLQEFHAQWLTAHGKSRTLYGTRPHAVPYEPKDICAPGIWICESYENPVAHCAYNKTDDPAMDGCVYCGQPRERK